MTKDLTDEEILQIRKDWRRPELVAQHRPSHLKKVFEGLFEFSDIKYGESKKGQGDIVIVNFKPLQNHVTLHEYLNHITFLDRIETVGIYTNIYWTPEFFAESIKNIISTTKYVEVD